MTPGSKTYTILFSLLLYFSFPAHAPAQVNATQYQVKAVFLYNFTRFVEWLAAAVQLREPFVIGIFGENVFGPHLREAIQNESFNGRPIQIRTVSTPGEARNCNLLFINRNKMDEFAAIQSQLAALSILTVSDADNFCQMGGIIGFINDKSRIRLQINTDAAASSNLKISSKLLRLADIITSKD